LPWVIEPAVSVERIFITLLLDAYDEDVINDEPRVVLRLHPNVAPVQVAVVPLSKKEDLIKVAREVQRSLQGELRVEYDQTGGTMCPIRTRSMRCSTVIVPVGNCRSLSRSSSGMARTSLVIRRRFSRSRSSTSALVASPCSTACSALMTLKSTIGVGLSSMIARIRPMIHGWVDATWCAITPTLRTSSSSFSLIPGVFTPWNHHCSSESDSTSWMNLFWAASNWSARAAERAVFVSAMTST